MPNIFQKRKAHGDMANKIITTCDTLVNGYTDEFKEEQIHDAERRRKEIECYVNKLKQVGGGNAREFAIDVEKVLKKTQEGIICFEELFEKFHTTNNAGLRRNYERGMRTEIKKIQRLRDQIKVWLLVGDAKDPSTLLSVKKDIENRMQRFRALEHDVRVRDYSDATLANMQGGKIPRVVQDFSDLSQWLTVRLNLFDTEINLVESQLEEIVSGSRKRMDQDTKDREERLKKYIDKHNYHVGMLEKLLRLLNNLIHDITSPALPEFIEQVNNIKDGIDYYLDDYQCEDFEDNEFLYDDIKALTDYQEIIDNPTFKHPLLDESDDKDDEDLNLTGISTSEQNELENGKKSPNDSNSSRITVSSSKSGPTCSKETDHPGPPQHKWSIADLVDKHQQITESRKFKEQNTGPVNVPHHDNRDLAAPFMFNPDQFKPIPQSSNVPPPASTIWNFIEASAATAAVVSGPSPRQRKSRSLPEEEDFPILGDLPLSLEPSRPQLWSSVVDTKPSPSTIENQKLRNPTSFYLPDPVVLPRPMLRRAEKKEVPLIKAEYNITTGQSFLYTTPLPQVQNTSVYTSTPNGSGHASPVNGFTHSHCQEAFQNGFVNTMPAPPEPKPLVPSSSVEQSLNYQSTTAANQRLLEARREFQEHKKAARNLVEEIKYLEQLTGLKANGGAGGDDCDSDESIYFSPNSSPRPQPLPQQKQHVKQEQSQFYQLPTQATPIHYSPTFTLCKLSTLSQIVDFSLYERFDDNVFFRMYYNKSDPYYASFATGILQYRNWKLGIEDDMWYYRLRGPFVKHHHLMAMYGRYNPTRDSYEYVEVPME